MKITQEIIDALKEATDGWGGISRLAKKSGVPQPYISRYIAGTTQNITIETWQKLEPHLSLEKRNAGQDIESALKEKGNTSEIQKLTTHELCEVPVISFAQAANYEPAIEPIHDYCSSCSDDTALFTEVRDNYFALRVDGDSMSPDFPHGTVILVGGGEYPQRGDTVVAKLNDGQVVCKSYHRKDNVITLSSINPDGKSFEWHCKEEPGFIQWMYPVIEATINLRRRRWEQTKGC